MKYVLLLVFTFGLIPMVNAQDSSPSEITTYYFIRHAEKDTSDSSNRNPHLTKEGQSRAVKWSTVLSNIKLDAVYSTNYHRTIETAQPSASKHNLEITTYDPFKMDKKAFIENTKGKTVLVVGHSNTTPMFANTIIGEEVYKQLDESNYTSLFIVTVTNGVASHQLLTIE
ncbi:histidine phosphatase family protein [Meridianimaribacter flavus]